MKVTEAKARARRWVEEEAASLPGFYGAFYTGSTLWLPDDADIAPTSDLDLWVVFDRPPPNKLGKFLYRDVLLEVSFVERDQLLSAEHVLGDYHMAGSFRRPGVILDPTGALTRMQEAVSRDFATLRWVRARCAAARDRVIERLGALDESLAFHDQVIGWLFPTGVTTHIVLVAGLQNPTIRTRYRAAHDLLAKYDLLAAYPMFLELLGCNGLTRAQVAQHLAALIEVFDTAKTFAPATSFPFATDISDVARPIAIDGSRDLIEQGYHREAVFWIVATYSRCQKILEYAAPLAMSRFDPAYRRLTADLGITSWADIKQRRETVIAALPRVSEVADAIIAANPHILP